MKNYNLDTKHGREKYAKALSAQALALRQGDDEPIGKTKHELCPKALAAFAKTGRLRDNAPTPFSEAFRPVDWTNVDGVLTHVPWSGGVAFQGYQSEHELPLPEPACDDFLTVRAEQEMLTFRPGSLKVVVLNGPKLEPTVEEGRAKLAEWAAAQSEAGSKSRPVPVSSELADYWARSLARRRAEQR